MLKKVFKVLVVFMILLIGAAIAIPAIYKDEIIALVNEEANKSLNATVSIGDVDLSFFSHFPSLTIDISNTTVVGKGTFEGVELASVKNLSLELNVFQLITSKGISIQGISIDQPTVDVRVLADGKANYDITIPSEEETPVTESETGSSDFSIALERYAINDAKIIYDDASLAVYCELNGLTHSGSGNFTTSIFDLITKTSIDALTLSYEGIPYLYKVNTKLDATLGMDLDKMHFAFKDNLLLINKLPLNFEGTIDMPENDIDMDLKFAAKNAGFKEALSLVPAIYATDMAGLSAEGNFTLSGAVKGTYNDLSYPGILMNLMVKDGLFKYADLPSDVRNVNIDFQLNSPEGADLDAMKIHLNEFSANLAGNPFFASLNLSKPMSNPTIAASSKGSIDFGKISSFIPLEAGEELNGNLKIDASVATDLNSVENEQYELVDFKGFMQLKNFSYASAELADKVLINNLVINASPKKVQLDACDVNIGNSDIQATGSLQNFIAYALSDQAILKGQLDVRSKNLDIDALMASTGGEIEEQNEDEETTDESLALIPIPQNLDMQMNVDFEMVIYDKIAMSPVEGAIVIKDGKAELSGLQMGLLGGSVNMSGSYFTPTEEKAFVDFGFQLSNMAIEKFVSTFSSVEQLAPIAKFCEGIFNSKLNFKGELDAFMNPIMTSLAGAGNLSSKTIGIKGFKPLDKVGDQLKMESIKSQSLNDVNVGFSFEDGKLNVQPFDIKLGNCETKVSGSNDFAGGMDYKLAMNIPSKLIAGNSSLSQLMGSTSGDMKVDVLVGGTITDPKISTSLKDIANSVVDKVKTQAKEKVQEQVDAAKEKANEEINKKIDALMAQAEKQAAEVRAAGKKSADVIRAEAKKQGEKLIKDAGSNLLKKKAAEIAANKLNKEADEKAKQVEAEANKKADGIMARAKAEADKLRR